MAVFGLLLLAIAGGFTADVVIQNHHKLDVDLFGATVTNASTARVFAAGMVTAGVAALGLLALSYGLRRSRRRRQALAVERANYVAAPVTTIPAGTEPAAQTTTGTVPVADADTDDATGGQASRRGRRRHSATTG